MIPANFKGADLSTLQTPQAGLPGAMMQYAKRLTESGQEVWRTWQPSGMMGPRVPTKKVHDLCMMKSTSWSLFKFRNLHGGAFQHVLVLIFSKGAPSLLYHLVVLRDLEWTAEKWQVSLVVEYARIYFDLKTI